MDPALVKPFLGKECKLLLLEGKHMWCLKGKIKKITEEFIEVEKPSGTVIVDSQFIRKVEAVI